MSARTMTGAPAGRQTSGQGNGGRISQPQYNQRGKEIQRYGTLTRMPLALDEEACAASVAGLNQVLAVLVMTGLAGGVIALCWAVAGGFLWQTLRGTAGLVFGFAQKGFRPDETLVLDNPLARKMPYAPAIAIGTICSFLGRH